MSFEFVLMVCYMHLLNGRKERMSFYSHVPLQRGSTFPVKYKDGSITFYWTNKIEYGHDERKYRLGAKGLEPDWDWWDDPD